ncbi:Ima1 N-terminal domain-containing protein [Phlyctochytrium arcticum]|nr:Ima1 N-terminal domain-containing protein [Phlyctochytrium arcticum]
MYWALPKGLSPFILPGLFAANVVNALPLRAWSGLWDWGIILLIILLAGLGVADAAKAAITTYHESPALRSVRLTVKNWSGTTATVECFYCNEPTSFEREHFSVSKSWFCHHCSSWCGTRDELDRHRPPVNKNIDGPKVVDLSSDAPFCDQCLQNQRLVLRLLAEYDPDDDDYFNETVEEYKEQLELRYPLTCSDCSVRVKHSLDVAYKRIRHHLLTRNLEKSQEWRNSSSNLASPKYAIFWVISIILLATTTLVAIMFHVYALRYPISAHSTRCDFVPTGAFSLEAFGSLFALPLSSVQVSQNWCLLFQMFSLLNLLSTHAVLLNPLWLMEVKQKAFVHHLPTYRRFQSRALLVRTLAACMLRFSFGYRITFVLNLLFLLFMLSYIIVAIGSIKVTRPVRLKTAARVVPGSRFSDSHAHTPSMGTKNSQEMDANMSIAAFGMRLDDGADAGQRAFVENRKLVRKYIKTLRTTLLITGVCRLLLSTLIPLAFPVVISTACIACLKAYSALKMRKNSAKTARKIMHSLSIILGLRAAICFLSFIPMDQLLDTNNYVYPAETGRALPTGLSLLVRCADIILLGSVGILSRQVETKWNQW